MPSAFFLADTFKYFDAKHLKGKLFKPDEKLNEDKATLAGREGLKAKRMIGALRYLWRSFSNSCAWRVQDLKDLLQKSLERPHRVPPPENPVPRNATSVQCFGFLLDGNFQVNGKVSWGPAVITPTTTKALDDGAVGCDDGDGPSHADAGPSQAESVDPSP